MLRLLSVAALVISTNGARIKKGKGGLAAEKGVATIIEGVSVLKSPSTARSSFSEKKWVVVLKKTAKSALIKKFCNSEEGAALLSSSTGKGRRSSAGERVCDLAGNPSEGGFAFLTLKAAEGRLGTFLRLLKKFGLGSMYVEEDQRAEMIPELEAKASASWGLDRVGSKSSSNKGRGVNVYVLDTGIRTSHSDFGGRASAAIDLSSGEAKECNGNPECAGDGQGHGTHCAGTVGGTNFGVAPEVNLFAGKVLSDSGTGSFSWSYAALDYCATQGARPAVASMSLGGPKIFGARGMRDAVNSAVEAGVIVVVAGGNDNTDACSFSPAFIPSAITVGSIDSTDTRSYFSNYGSCTDIWAPGSAITSAAHTSNDGSATFSGTSMACPHVSGGVALTLENSPDMTSEQVLKSLLSRAVSGTVKDLKADDTNALMWLSDDAAPPSPQAPAPLRCPDFARNIAPDAKGECQCTGVLSKCTRADGNKCPSSRGWPRRNYFEATCTDCECN